MFAVQRLLKRRKDNPKTGKKIVNHVPNKGVVSRIHKEVSKLKRKKQIIQLKHRLKKLKRHDANFT